MGMMERWNKGFWGIDEVFHWEKQLSRHGRNKNLVSNPIHLDAILHHSIFPIFHYSVWEARLSNIKKQLQYQ